MRELTAEKKRPNRRERRKFTRNRLKALKRVASNHGISVRELVDNLVREQKQKNHENKDIKI